MSDAAGGRGIGCQIGRTSPWSCFTGQGVAESFFVGNVSSELRVLVAAGGAKTKSDGNWLPVAELRNSLMKVLEPSTEVGFNQKMCCDMSCFCDRICMFVRHGIMFVTYQGSTNKYLQHLLHLFRSL